MAKIRLNPVFMSVKGNIGKIIHYKRNGVQCSRIHVIPRNPDTHAQRSNRNTFAAAVKAWQELLPEDKRIWNTRAKDKGKTGYNYFLSQYLKKGL